MNSQLSPLLQQAEAKVEAGIKPQFKEAYQRIVIAGMKVAFDPSTHGSIVDGLRQSKNPIHDVAVGTVGMLILLSQQSKGTMPVPAMVPAGMTLLINGLDYLEKTNVLKVDANMLGDATNIYITTLMPKIGITPQKMQQIAQQTHGAMNNPQFMAQFQGAK